ncbi:MAG: RnfABCDGE type electron transport complex subunit B [Prevotellaceae bacterium]|nr:RnfABCDGE type electron transport complex subunit B [Prevotellaceae bacterium]
MFIFTVVILSALGVFFAVVLYFVAQKFKVIEDPRIDDVTAVLPGANCGGCGFAGCRAFAEKCVAADSLDGLFCPVGGNTVMGVTAQILGKTAPEKAPMVAVLRCGGAKDKRELTNRYDGLASCAVAATLYDGNTACRYGCLMLGDCVHACAFDALQIDSESGMPIVDDTKCTACRACVRSCPKSLVELRNMGPKRRRVYVSCQNKEKGATARKACKATCIGCGKCVKVCTFEAITLENNLAYINDQKCKLCRKCVGECPTGSIIEVHFPERKEASLQVEQNLFTTP